MRILAVSPHPDDVDVACAGFLYLAAASGHAVTVACHSNGETGGDPDQRRREQLAAAQTYAAECVFLDGVDTQLQVDRQTVHQAEALLRDLEPDLVVLPAATDSHQDHRASHQIFLSAARYHQSIICYETPTTLSFAPDVFVDVSQVLRAKRNALACHASQLGKPRSIFEASRAFYRYRGWQGRVQAAEGFEVVRLGAGLLIGHGSSIPAVRS